MSIKSKDSKHSKETAIVSLSTNFESLALQELAKYSEAEIQTLIVEPLLRSLGFENVKDNRGAKEKGKDLIATKISEFGRTKLYAIQIKKAKYVFRDVVSHVGLRFRMSC